MRHHWLLSLHLAWPKVALVAVVIALGLSLAVLPWKWAVLLVAGGTLVLGLLVHPYYALCLLAFAVPFGSIREVPLGPVNVSASEVLISLLLAVWVARMVANRRIVIPHPPLLLPLCAFLGVILLSILGATSLELSSKEVVKWVEILIVYLFMASDWPYGSLNSAAVPAWARWVVWSLLAAGSAEALVGIYQFLRRVGPEGFVLFGRFMRAYGHFAQPNPFAGYLGLTLPLAYALTLDARDAWSHRAASGQSTWQDTQTSLWNKLRHAAPYAGSVAALGIMSIATLMSWSRGAWVGMAAALGVVTIVRSRRALALALVVAVAAAYLLAIGGAQYLPAALVQRISDFLPYVGGLDVRSVQVTDANFAVVERMAHWIAAIGMFTDHPWLGVGIGNYPVAYARYAIGRWRDPLGHAHNYYLNIAAEAGAVGLLAYLALFTACVVYAWRVTQRTHGFWRAIALGALGILIHLSVHNLFDNLYVHSMNIQLGLTLGLLAIADKSASIHDAYRN